MKVIDTTYPMAGETKFSPINQELANKIAENFYDVVALPKQEDGSYSVKCIGGYVAIIGTLSGVPAILHKNPNGSRTLEVLDIT